jgi:metallo-beta-lactamase class B
MLKPTALLCLLLSSALLGCAASPTQSVPAAQRLTADMEVRPLGDGLWLNTWSTEIEGWGRVSSNGLIVVSANEALLIDTPGDDARTERLLAWARETLKAPIHQAIVTHSHFDRIGGIGALKQASITTYALPQTADLAEAKQWPRPDMALEPDQLITVGERSVRTFFPGAGHTPDNLVVWLEREKLLYGGCFVKDEHAFSIGNLGDADVAEWPRSLARVKQRFPLMQVVVPGHGEVGGPKALDHTLELLPSGTSAVQR